VARALGGARRCELVELHALPQRRPRVELRIDANTLEIHAARDAPDPPLRHAGRPHPLRRDALATYPRSGPWRRDRRRGRPG